MKNKKAISSFVKLGIAFLSVAIVLGIVIYTGANHPPLRFPNIGETTSKYVHDLSQRDVKDVCLSLSSQGPFKWDNSNDLGARRTLGEWASELDHETVIYYRRDKDAVWQGRAQDILANVDRISEELSEYLGRICCSADSANGRKLPIYIPETGQEYALVLSELCDGLRSPSNPRGSSIIQIGPLGCQDKGIILHPDLFTSDKDYIEVLRREMARYAYYSSVDYNEEINHPVWFSEAVLDYFVQASDSVNVISKDLTDWAEKEFNLSGGKTARGESLGKVGASFFQFVASSEGEGALMELIQGSFSESLDSAFVRSGLDFEQLKRDWIQSLRGVQAEEEALL